MLWVNVLIRSTYVCMLQNLRFTGCGYIYFFVEHYTLFIILYFTSMGIKMFIFKVAYMVHINYSYYFLQGFVLYLYFYVHRKHI